MKRITFICLLFIAGCSEDQEMNRSESQWSVSWKIGNEELRGDLVLFHDHKAQLQVYGEPQSLLVKAPREINFSWRISDDKLTLKRLDNDVELEYKILHESAERMELAFAEDITVTLYRH